MEISSRECGGIERKLGEAEGRPQGDGIAPARNTSPSDRPIRCAGNEWRYVLHVALRNA